MPGISLQDPLSSTRAKQYTDFAADVDLRLSALEKPCRGLMVGEPGVVVLLLADDTEEAFETFGNDTFLPVQAFAILTAGTEGGNAEGSTTTAASVTVFW